MPVARKTDDLEKRTGKRKRMAFKRKAKYSTLRTEPRFELCIRLRDPTVNTFDKLVVGHWLKVSLDTVNLQAKFLQYILVLKLTQRMAVAGTETLVIVRILWYVEAVVCYPLSCLPWRAIVRGSVPETKTKCLLKELWHLNSKIALRTSPCAPSRAIISGRVQLVGKQVSETVLISEMYERFV